MTSPLALEDKVAELAATIRMLGLRFLEGAHRSPRTGQGLEFESLQPYQAGDDIRQLDWKKLAATDRPFVRRKHPERRNHWHLVLDHSASMGYGKKWDYVQIFVGTLVMLFQRWGDSCHLWPGGGRSFEEILRGLVESPGGSTDFMSLTRGLPDEAQSRIILVSDFMMPFGGLKKLQRGSFAVQVLDGQEVDFPFSETLEFRDCESAAKLLLPSAQIRSAYQEEFKRFQGELREFFNADSQFFSFRAEPDRIVEDLVNFFEQWRE